MSRPFGRIRSFLFTLTLALSAASIAACGSDADDGLDGPSEPEAGAGGDESVESKGGSSAKGGSSSKGGSNGKGGSSAKGGTGGTEGDAGEGGTDGGSGGDAGEGGSGSDAGTGGVGGAGKAGSGGAAGKGAGGGSAGKSGAGGNGQGGMGGGGAGKSGAGGSAGKGGSSGQGGAGGSAGKAGTGGSAGSGTGGSTGVVARETCAASATGVRIMASNLTTGNKQNYEAPGINILKTIKPDVILMQEFKPASGSLENLVAEVCGPTCAFHRGGGNIPNGVISRYPILEAGTWDDVEMTDREFEWARIDLPGPRDLLAISVHLHTEEKKYPEATALVALIKANAKATDYVVLGGDFNTSTYEDPVFPTLSEVLSVAAPHPADQTGNTGTNTNRLMEGKGKPYDHVVVNATLRAHEIPLVIGANTFAAGAVIDTRVHNPIEDLAPAVAGDSGALNMQHMGVVRSYCVPKN